MPSDSTTIALRGGGSGSPLLSLPGCTFVERDEPRLNRVQKLHIALIVGFMSSMIGASAPGAMNTGVGSIS